MHKHLFDPGIEKAIQISLLAHGDQTRKGSDIPYASHPIHVAIKLIRLGCPSEVVQAGLLHDVVEDCDGWTLQRIGDMFSERVVGWVAELTDQEGADWESRKQTAVDKVPTMSIEAATIKGADKLHNLSSLVRQLEQATDREAVWVHFSRGPEQTIDMAERLVEALHGRIPVQLSAELKATLERLRELCQGL